jgi:hypothetical protein
MIIRVHQLCILGLLALLMVGCAGSKKQQTAQSRQQEGIPAGSPALRMADHHEWVKRLLVSPPVEAIQLTSGGNAVVYPVPLLPSVTATGVSYSLKIDSQAQLVWLQSHGYGGSLQEVNGPWRMAQPDAAHLLHSITNPPTNPALQQ